MTVASSATYSPDPIAAGTYILRVRARSNEFLVGTAIP